MPAPLGNKFAEGNPGGSRKSAYEEMADAQILVDIWDGKYTEEGLKKIITEKKHGVKHIFAAKCMSGDIKMIAKLIDKLYANRQAIDFNPKEIERLDEFREDLNKLIKNAKAKAAKDTAGDQAGVPASV